VRIEDVNGPRGGVDVACRLKVALHGLPSVVIEQTATTVGVAVDRAIDAAERAVSRAIDRARATAAPPARIVRVRRPTPARAKAPPREVIEGSLIGRRVGRAGTNLERALERPEKLRRDAYVDTSRSGTSASDRRAGGPSTARRNTRRSTSRATATLEDSMRATPSRKSTRKSANRSKQGNLQAQRATRKARAAKTRARKAAAAKATRRR
jgi:hypothetical protein